VIKHYLLAPGPTPVPPRVLLAMAQPLIHHRSAQFSLLFEEVRQRLRKLFGTEQDVLVLATSGSGGMEAAVANCFGAGDKVIVVNSGKFGERWLELCKSFEVEAVEISVDWGKAVAVDQVEAVLQEHQDARGLLVQATETSTTVFHPIERLAALTRRRDVLLVVDGITAVGVCEMPMDRWGIDVLVTGSQKALMLPPGLAFVALSQRAWAKVEQTKQRRFYFDLLRERTNQTKRTTAFTPAISLIIGLRESLAMIEEEGIQAVYARHDRMARATRAAVRALGLQLVAPEHPSPAATGLYVPGEIDGSRLIAYLRDSLHMTFGGGQGRFKGKVVRIGHLGYMDSMDTLVAVGALEMALCRLGHLVNLGKGVAAAEEIFIESLPQ